ncbi:MAG TPA: glycosyltransferase family 2 protein [Rhodothermales bacterium]
MPLLLLVATVHFLLIAILVVNLTELLRRRKSGESTERLPSLSVLIPARNEAAHLRRLIPELLGQRYDGLEVIVYDDHSEDETQSVLAQFADPRLKTIVGGDIPDGWIGKVHALYRATREARGELYLFLDADVSLRHEYALRTLVGRYLTLPAGPAVLTGLTHLVGRGLLLVSLVPNAVLTTHPWPVLRRYRFRGGGALNGQCWLTSAEIYHRFEPHREFPAEVLEDVRIGRFLAAKGVIPHLVDVRDELRVRMYDSFAEAWRGFRKNAYLLMSGRPVGFIPLATLFFLAFVVGPILHPVFLCTVFLLKLATDRVARMPWWVTALTPVSVALAVVQQWDSAIHHWLGRVEWKGRRV